MRRSPAVPLLALAIVSCGGGAPTAPAAPAPSGGPTVISATPRGVPDLMVAGESAQLSLSVTFDDGAQEIVTDGAIWSSSDPAVATVDEAGGLTARARGRATIGATINGVSVSAPVGVVPDVSGVWAITMPAGDGRWTDVTFAEIEQQAAAISGRWQWDSGVALTIEGSVNEKGALSLSGRDCYSGNTYGYVLFKASDWVMSFDETDGMYEGMLTMSRSGRYMGGPCSGWILRDEPPTVTAMPVTIEVR